MIPEGVLSPVEGGFKIFIQNNFTDKPGANRRQRFTIAHELAHTFYYDLNGEVPKRSKGSPKGQKLERLCHIGASQILVPEILLRHEVEKNGEVESAESVLDLASIFDVSPEVMIRRLHGLNGIIRDNFAAILVETVNGGNQLIHAACYSPLLLCHVTKPERNLNFDSWVTPLLPPSLAPESPEWIHSTLSALITAKKVRRSKRSFILDLRFDRPKS